ncbi:MAG: efflux RND transporter periplasmic adaptor subunit, partial [Gallionella sp.]|nr:efflux RND transporter periplasmic adaptor subunit [Gallionella sp.]
MKPINMVIIVVAALLGVGATGYWLGTRTATQAQAAPAAEKAVKAERRILYYRNPMGLPDTSQTPKKDSMGMDYIPVYEGEDGQGSAASSSDTSGQVKISVEKVQKLGVKTEQAAMRLLDKTVRAVGRVDVDERHIYNIAPKFEGWIEKLHVKTTGEPVKKGQALLDIYSPELVSAQREYAIAMQGVAALKDADADTRQSMQRLADAALQRLRNWDISGQQVEDLASSGT